MLATEDERSRAQLAPTRKNLAFFLKLTLMRKIRIAYTELIKGINHIWATGYLTNLLIQTDRTESYSRFRC